jgi:predicted component of type VI protein secretion system
MATLERVFNTRLIESQELCFKDFKAECQSVMSYLDFSEFEEMAAVLLFVEPSEIKQCQE